MAAAADQARTAGLPVQARQRLGARRSAPVHRQLSFNLLSGEALSPAPSSTAESSEGGGALAGSAPGVGAEFGGAAAAPLVWQGGCAFLAGGGEQTERPAAPVASCGLDTAVHAQADVVPFAVDDALTRRCAEAVAPIERDLMQLSIQKDRLESELARMPMGAGRTAAERQSKSILEARIAEAGQRARELRATLRTLRPMRR